MTCETTPILDTHPTLSEELAPYRGARACFIPLAGNNGDKLIEAGARHVLDRCRFELVDDRHRADVIIINGGAKLWDENVDMFLPSSQQCPRTPLIVLPSSFLFRGDEFHRCFAAREAPATLFARERYSLEVLRSMQSPAAVSCRLDHDMAFALADSPLLQELRTRSAAEHVLVVERFDRECATTPMKTIPGFIKACIPAAIARPLKRWRRTRQCAKSGFGSRVLDRVLAQYPQYRGTPVISEDISREDTCGFQEFLERVAKAAVVITTRLHVAILAALLGKNTLIKPSAGGYKKIQGVYEYSLARLPNISLLE